MQPFDPLTARLEFPALVSKSTSQQPIIYLDNAASTQKPQCVIDCLSQYYATANSNVHRASNSISVNSTQRFEDARITIAKFINAEQKEIIFTRGTTEGVNLVANSYLLNFLNSGDEIILSEIEHHSNFVPWQIAAEKIGAKIIPWRINKASCTLDLSDLEKLLNSRTRFVALSHMSNVTGTRNPIEEAIFLAHKHGALVLIDGAQGIVHEKVNIKELDADFYVFSGHKLFSTSGIGVLFGKYSILSSMPPWQAGGKMIKQVSFNNTSFTLPPARFEAGTPYVAGAIALARSIEWLEQFDRKKIENHIARLQQKLIHGLSTIKGIEFIGLQTPSSIVSFNVKDIHHSDIAILLDNQGIAVRAGSFCAQPLLEALNIKGGIRISIALYNTEQDIENCINAVNKACEML